MTRSNYDDSSRYYDTAHSSAANVSRWNRIESSMSALARGRFVLEVGIGTGRFARKLKDSQVVGLDPSLPMLRAAQVKGGGKWQLVVGNAEKIPFDSQRFECVVAPKGVFRYLDCKVAFAECSRVLQRGGFLSLHQFSDHVWARNRPKAHAGHLPSVDQYAQIAAQHQLHMTSVEYWRSIRLYPYALKIPQWLPDTLWSHCVLTFQKC